MAANHGPKDTFIYFPFKLTPLERAQIDMQFDLNCDMDEKDIKAMAKEIKFLKKVCIYKLITCIPDLSLTLIMFGKEETVYKWKTIVLYWKFFRNKIPLENFGKQLTKLMTSGKVL